MTIQKLPGAAIAPGTITVTQLDSSTATVIQTGGGPKITAIAVTDNAYTVLDDTAVDTGGGYIKITGTGFVTGCSVIIGTLPASSVSFISSTEVRVQVGAQVAGTYIVYLVNPDGGVGIRVNGLTYSANPAWQTASGLPDQYDGVAISLSLVATDATSYTITSGSLPPGLSLAANTGVISGTVTGVAVDTTYTFTVRATDAQNQDSPRTFTVTITVSDPYFKLTTLLLGGEQGNTVVRDSSVNNFNLTVFGDSRASNFTPYGTGWSVQFDGTGDYLSGATGVESAFNLAADFTVEAWVYFTALASYNSWITFADSSGNNGWQFMTETNKLQFQMFTTGVYYSTTSTNSLVTNTWYHVAATRVGSTITVYINGVANGTSTYAGNPTSASSYLRIGADRTTSYYFNGYLSNLRVVKGTAVYTANFTPATTTLTAVANTSLLTCHASRFLDGSTNNFAITRNGDAAVRSFNPFNITNTGDSGSMYFDGTGDYVTVANNVALQLSNSVAWTVEFWFYANAMSAEQLLLNSYLITGTPNYNGIGISLGSNSQAATTMTFWDGTTWTNIATGLTPARWYHVAVSFEGSGTTRRFFLDGGLQGSAGTCPASITNTANPTAFGALSNGVIPFNGYISNARIVKGSAVYTANFTPATTALTAIANTQLLTLQYRQPHNNHGFQDSSSNNFLITRNGNASQGSFSPFSQTGWSNYFAASSTNALTFATGSGVAYGTGDFCQEFFLYANSYPSLWRIISYSAACASMLQQSGAVLNLDTGVGTLNTGITLPTNTWFHLAYTRQSGRIRVFVDGVLRYNIADATSYSNASVDIGGAAGFSQSWDGYISNARIIKGSVPAAYQTSSTTNSTTIFTPPTSPLTAVTGTELLTCQSNRFADTNTQTTAKTITVTGSPSVRAWSPFAPTAVYSPAVHGGSLYLDGTGDALQIASNPVFNVASADITIELWYYPLSIPVEGEILELGSGGTTGDVQLILRSTGFTFGGSGQTKSDASAVINQWYHLAAVKTGTTYYLYVNGSRNTTQSGAGSASSSTVVNIGSRNNSANYISGYISNFRISNYSRYTSTTITVPTGPVTTDANTTVLLNFTDAAIVDRTGRTVIETVADARTSSVQVKYGTGAMYFDGTGDRALIPASPNLTFGTSDFTIEMWIWAAAQGSTSARVMGNGAGGSWGANKWIFTTTTASNPNKYSFQFWNYNSGGADLLVSTSASNNSTWVHVAITRAGSTFRMFVNGVVEATQTSANSLDGGVSVNLEIGRSGLTGEDWAGYLDDLRITRGYARYTANFTPPTASHRLK